MVQTPSAEMGNANSAIVAPRSTMQAMSSPGASARHHGGRVSRTLGADTPTVRANLSPRRAAQARHWTEYKEAW
jgi:hypothetical protein